MPKHVLVADDSLTIRKAIGMIFATEDVQLTTVDNGVDAIQRARELRPDVVVADVTMPGKSGYEVCEALKQDPSTQAIPVLLLAGTYEPFDEGRAKASGANDHIVKPFESQALIDKVRVLTGGTPSAARPVQQFTTVGQAGAQQGAPRPTSPGMPMPGGPPIGGGMRPAPMTNPGTNAAPNLRPSAPGMPMPGGPQMRPAPGTAPGQRPGGPPIGGGMRGPPMSSPGMPMPGGPPIGGGMRGPPMSNPQMAMAGGPPIGGGMRAAPMSSPGMPMAPGQMRPGGQGMPLPHAPQPMQQMPRPPQQGMPMARPPGAPMPGQGMPMPQQGGAPRGRDPFGLGGPGPAQQARPRQNEPPPSVDDGMPSDEVPVARARPADGGEGALREALSKASREVIEKIAWEVVPQLAETIIREELERLIKEREGRT